MTEFPTDGMEMTHILVVEDLAASAAWYQGVLGATPYREYGTASAVFSFAGSWLLLVTGGEPTADKADVTFAPVADPSRVSHSFTVRVDDCRRSYETLTARGAQFLSPPYDWGGEIRCFFRDPDGHLFEISQAG